MSKLKVSDFYYGAVLSILLNKHITPALIEGDEDRQVYDFTTNSGEYRLFIKYSSSKRNNKTDDYNSWIFNFTDNKSEILKYIDSGHNLRVALVCCLAGLAGSEIVVLDKDEIKQIIDLNKNLITVSRKKHEHAFRIPVGGGRENSIRIKTSRFDELF